MIVEYRFPICERRCPFPEETILYDEDLHPVETQRLTRDRLQGIFMSTTFLSRFLNHELTRMIRRRENMRNMVCVGTELAKQTFLDWWFSAGLGLTRSCPCPLMILEFSLLSSVVDRARRKIRVRREVVGLLIEANAEDWPVAGPRTPSWCARFLNRRSGSRLIGIDFDVPL